MEVHTYKKGQVRSVSDHQLITQLRVFDGVPVGKVECVSSLSCWSVTPVYAVTVVRYRRFLADHDDDDYGLSRRRWGSKIRIVLG